MRTVQRIALAATLTAGLGAVAASPASAASEPAVTSCSFTPIYSTYQNGQLSDPRYHYSRGTEITVSNGDGYAWLVTVKRNGDTGWMEAACVRFLA
ncbi:MAG TPA: hypothetical protein VFX61_05265 [Micromonosporaceae bacterium]|nr:hypothetical protein [Micromonosporaceae bacterium]